MDYREKCISIDNLHCFGADLYIHTRIFYLTASNNNLVNVFFKSRLNIFRGYSQYTKKKTQNQVPTIAKYALKSSHKRNISLLHIIIHAYRFVYDEKTKRLCLACELDEK